MSNNEFKCTEDGVFYNDDKICDYLKIAGLIKTQAEKDWKLSVEFKDMAEEKCTIDIDNDKFPNINDFIKELLRKGLCPDIDNIKLKQYLVQLLRNRNSLKRYTEVSQSGWINDTDYICPSFCVSNSKNLYIFNENKEFGYEKKGTLEEWKSQIAEPCKNNSLLTFVLCASFAPVLLKYFPEINTTIFHLVGKSSIGKTTALKVAASVWGYPKKYIKQWRATGNAQESLAEGYNDGLLILDEIGQAEDDEIQNTVYMLGNEKGKARSKVDASLRKTKSWRLLSLSSGEIGISEKIESAGNRVHGGVLVRCIDIEAQSSQEMGIFEDLRNFSSGNEFSTVIAERASKYYGVAAEYFVNGLRDFDEHTIRNIFDNSIKQLKESLNLQDTKEGAILRVLNTFALVNMAGILACDDNIGVLPHDFNDIDKDICNVLQRCLPNIYSQENEESEMLEDFKDWLKRNEMYFISAELVNDTSSEKIRKIGTQQEEVRTQIFGYRIKDADVYYILPSIFKKEFCKGRGEKTIKRILLKRNMLRELPEKENGKIKRRNPKIIVNNEKEKRYLEVHNTELV